MYDANVSDELEVLGYTTEQYIKEKEELEKRRKLKQKQRNKRSKTKDRMEFYRVRDVDPILMVILDGANRIKLFKDGDAYKIDVRKYMGPRPTIRGNIIDAKKFAIGAECILQKLIEMGVTWDKQRRPEIVSLEKKPNIEQPKIK